LVREQGIQIKEQQLEIRGWLAVNTCHLSNEKRIGQRFEWIAQELQKHIKNPGIIYYD
jgi:hypothetical protein